MVFLHLGDASPALLIALLAKRSCEPSNGTSAVDATPQSLGVNWHKSRTTTAQLYVEYIKLNKVKLYLEEVLLKTGYLQTVRDRSRPSVLRWV